MTLKKVLPVAWDYVVLTFGTLLYCLAWVSFMIPNNISSGGLTGACTILQYATMGAIPMAISFFVLNVLLIISGSIVLGKGFGIKTVYVVILSSVLFEILPAYDFLKALPGNFLYIDNALLVPIVGGILESLGIGLIILRGGSTGGTDIAVLIVNKFWPVSPGKVYLYSDLVIIASVLLVPGKGFEDMIFGYIAMITFSFMLDFVLLGNKTTFQVMVFSEKYEEIADFIINKLDRGVTALRAVGWYTRKDRNVLLILVRKPQIRELTKAIKEIDGKAFVSVSPATGVYGEGFDEIMLYCALGGRLDHLIGNIQAGAFAAKNGVRFTIIDSRNLIYIIGGGSVAPEMREGFSLSVLALSDVCEGVTIRGAKYGLENATITNTFPIGVSNERRGEVTVSLKSGILMVILSEM